MGGSSLHDSDDPPRYLEAIEADSKAIKRQCGRVELTVASLPSAS